MRPEVEIQPSRWRHGIRRLIDNSLAGTFETHGATRGGRRRSNRPYLKRTGFTPPTVISDSTQSRIDSSSDRNSMPKASLIRSFRSSHPFQTALNSASRAFMLSGKGSTSVAPAKPNSGSRRSMLAQISSTSRVSVDHAMNRSPFVKPSSLKHANMCLGYITHVDRIPRAIRAHHILHVLAE